MKVNQKNFTPILTRKGFTRQILLRATYTDTKNFANNKFMLVVYIVLIHV